MTLKPYLAEHVGFVGAATLGDVSKIECVNDGIPKGTKSVQINAFCVHDNKKYLHTEHLLRWCGETSPGSRGQQVNCL